MVFVPLGRACLLVWRLHVAEPVVSVDERARFRALAAKAAGGEAAAGDEAWAVLTAAITVAQEVDRSVQDDGRSGALPRRDEADQGYPDYFALLETGRDELDRTRAVTTLDRLAARGFFSMTRDLATLGVGLRPIDAPGSMMWEPMPDVAGTRLLATILAAQMHREADAAGLSTALDRFDEMLALGRAASHQPQFIWYASGIAIQGMALRELRFQLAERHPDVETCRALQRLIEARPLAPFLLSLEGERAVFRDWVQRVFSDDGAGGGYLIPRAFDESGKLGLGAAFRCRFRVASRRELLEAHDAYIEGALAEAALPDWERWRGGYDGAPLMQGRLEYFQLGFSPVVGVFENVTRGRLAVTGTLAMLALEAHRDMHGTYPRTLDALVPDLLAELPIDPFDGEPLGYELHEDPADPHYLLFSRATGDVLNPPRPREW